MSSHLGRRLFLGGALGAAASPFLLPRSMARATGADNPFSLGVASGEPSPDGFVIWTRLAPRPMDRDGLGGLSAPATVRWEVASDEAMTAIVQSGDVQADARLAYSVHVETTGLPPGRPYWYRFTALGAQSPVGRAMTAPDRGGSLAGMKIGAASCAHYEAGWFSAYRHMAAERPDLVLFLGDYIYEYSYPMTRTTVVRRHDQLEEAATLADYRRRYALAKQDKDLQDLHLAAPALVTWDDHEVQNDYADRWSQFGGTPEAVFLARRAAAYQAFYEHMPVRKRAIPVGPNARLYERFAFGDLVEFTVLDERQYRSIQACPNGNSRRAHLADCADLADPSRTMLGLEQERWLYEGMKDAPARWNLIAQQVQFTNFLQKDAKGKPGQFTDGWGGYAPARQRLVDSMVSSRLRNPVVLGGDLHAFCVGSVKADQTDPASASVAAEFIGTSITSDKAPDSLVEDARSNPHLKLFENAYRGYLSMTVARDHLETRLRVISERTDPDATVSTLARFTVEAGKPGVLT